jgi:POLQ-like helicase
MKGRQMKPEFNSRRLFGITRSKGKMYELSLAEELHIAVPENSEPRELFLLAVGTLGDVAATLSDAEDVDAPLPPATIEELSFAASFFDAFLESRFDTEISRDTALLAASAYYLAHRPGSSLVLARQIDADAEDSAVDKLLHWLLQAQWTNYPSGEHLLFGTELGKLAKLLAFHFHDGSGLLELTAVIKNVKRLAYDGASARDLLFIDIIAAIARMRLSASAWTTLPGFTDIHAEQWATAIRRPEFPKELWPSQILLGKAGLFQGSSGIIQMPTSAGKTRSVEIILRSGFLSGRTKLAVVVAPFRALCHEIGTSLRHAFRNDDVKVNELSDAMQLDFLEQVAELFGSEAPASKYILVLTPEKFLYVLRQTPSLVHDIGIVVYDEGHQFDSGSRGIIYELLLTEIKALLPAGAQTVLVSAVIQNAKAIGEWLIGEGSKVVNGKGLLPTARSVAFASWIEQRGQLMFFDSGSYDNRDYFVPRVIEQMTFVPKPRETTDKVFPGKDSSNDIALYLGIRLVPHGAVAIFCGRKDTASGIAKRAVEVYKRGFEVAPPAASANSDELRRIKHLVDEHFGVESTASKAASLGVFVHHGTTPQGLRLSIEHAMQKSLINFVVCTSTLAQGVNLPIRYLIVTGIYQAGERLKVRDFQNLIGRAGRSGMHTEGMVIFSDPEVYDRRQQQQQESWKFSSSVALLNPGGAESTTSSLLELLSPIAVGNDQVLTLTTEQLCGLLLLEEREWSSLANEVVRLNPQIQIDARALVKEFRRRYRLLSSVESYLMANRGTKSYGAFKIAVEKLATSTLAFHLAPEDQKPSVKTLFVSVADFLEQQEPAIEKQATYSKTLLGIRNAKAIERWVDGAREELLELNSNEAWLSKIWELFSQQSDDKFFHTVEPHDLSQQLAVMWLNGCPYKAIYAHAKRKGGTKLWGESKRRKLTEDEIMSFCENTLGFDCTLVLAAAAQFLFGENSINNEAATALTVFQKSLKYGLPDEQTISCYESGFADRVIAQHLFSVVRGDGFQGRFFSAAITAHRARIQTSLLNYPSYFETVLNA